MCSRDGDLTCVGKKYAADRDGFGEMGEGDLREKLLTFGNFDKRKGKEVWTGKL